MRVVPDPPVYPDRFALRIRGAPVPQGSKTARYRKQGNKIVTWVVDANDDRLKPFRETVTDVATTEVIMSDWTTIPRHQPARVDLVFTFDRPPSHYRTGRNAHLLKDDAPTFPGNNCGDIDKLQRAIFDSLTAALVWDDDTQVTEVRARKVYVGEDEHAAPTAGIDVVVRRLGQEATLL